MNIYRLKSVVAKAATATMVPTPLNNPVPINSRY